MAVPTRIRTDGTDVTTAATTWNINLGTPGPSAGHLLIVFVRFAAAPGAVTFTGYTVLAGPDATDASDDTNTIFYRVADGSEGVSDVLSPTNSVKGCALVVRISGADDPALGANFTPKVSAVAVGTTAANSAQPNSVAPFDPPQDTLYLAYMGLDGEGNAPSGAPSGYLGMNTANSGTGGAVATNCSMGVPFKEALASSSDTPGAFTHAAAATGWTAWAVAVRPPQAPVAPPTLFYVTA